jgi:predicted nucleotide-binding protein
MQKTRQFRRTKFPARVILEAVARFQSLAPLQKEEGDNLKLTVSRDDESWDYDTIEEFLADYGRGLVDSSFSFLRRGGWFSFSTHLNYENTNCRTQASVRLRQRSEIESVLGIFEHSAESAKLPDPPPPPTPPREPPVIFIGHGHSEQWKVLKDHLHEKHGYQVEAYEVGARAGHHIRDILGQMALRSQFALLVLTAEDVDSDGKFHARENVIHETGLFQGKLGWDRAIVLLEDGTNKFSNLDGIQQLRFPNGRIKETIGDVLATLKREFSD